MLNSSQLLKEKEEAKQLCDELWEFFSSLSDEKKHIEESLTLLEQEHLDMQSSVNRYTQIMENMPLIAIAQKWVKDFVIRHSYNQDELNGFKFLYQKGIIPVKNSSGIYFTVNDLRILGHEEIIENIRSLQEISVNHKEKLIAIYSDFASYLSKFTFGFLERPKDPDKEKTKNRLISLECFQEFSSFLSVRDTLIAEVMYFTGKPLNQIVHLKVKDIDIDKQVIAFKDANTIIPRHLTKRLQEYVRDKKSNSLIFTNRQGQGVNRTHMLLAFKKASQKMSQPTNITPKSLVASSKY